MAVVLNYDVIQMILKPPRIDAINDFDQMYTNQQDAQN